MEVYIVYAIRSEIDGRIYVGFTSDLDRRIKEHNTGKTRSTKGYSPWELVYTRTVNSREAARRLEKYYKTGVGKEFLKRMVP